jgi:CheY-like chemotaxis protein
LRILFVEDHADSRSALANLLTQNGYNVSVANCAGTALHLLNVDKFDVILSDIGLPDGSGYGLVMLAKQRQGSIMAIALTGFAAAEDVRFSKEVGFDFHLTKPVDFRKLTTVLNAARVVKTPTSRNYSGPAVCSAGPSDFVCSAPLSVPSDTV